MVRIAIISKHEEDRKTINALLAEQGDFQIVSMGADAYDAINAAMTQQPDIIIMDFSMEDTNSADLAPIIKRNSPSTSIIVLYSHNEQDVVDKSLRAGISGCLLRQGNFDNLVSSIRSVYHGGLYISEKTKNCGLPSIPVGDAYIAQKTFSTTELCIFYGIIHGYTDKEIAKSLNMSTSSLRNCVSRVKHKTGLHNRTQITVHALLDGIIAIGKIRGMFL